MGKGNDWDTLPVIEGVPMNQAYKGSDKFAHLCDY